MKLALGSLGGYGQEETPCHCLLVGWGEGAASGSCSGMCSSAQVFPQQSGGQNGKGKSPSF